MLSRILKLVFSYLVHFLTELYSYLPTQPQQKQKVILKQTASNKLAEKTTKKNIQKTHFLS